MKKKISIIATALLLVAAMLVGLCACGSTWNKVKSAYEKEGYSEANLSDTIKKALNLDNADTGDFKATLHFMTTAELSKEPTTLELAGLLLAKNAVILEFNNTDELKKYAKENFSEEENEDFEAAWAEFQKLDNVNGNCVLLLGDTTIFKGTK